jgi:hypothetical protein
MIIGKETRMQTATRYEPANPKMGRTRAYGVVLVDGGPVHLTLPAIGQTLCQIDLLRGRYGAAPFEADGCETCRRMAQVRELTISGDTLPY